MLLVKYLLTSLKIKFVLSGNCQTDNLEARFGQHRQLSDGNTLISVEEVLQSEKKLRVYSLLKIYSSCQGIITTEDFFTEFNTSEALSDYDPVFVNNFSYDRIDIDNDCLNVVVNVARYIAKKTASLKTVVLLLVTKKKLEMNVDANLLLYFDNLNIKILCGWHDLSQ